MRKVGHIGHRNLSIAPGPRVGVRSHAWLKATKLPRSRLRPRTVGGAPAPMEPPRPVRWGSGFFPGPGPSATTPIPLASQTPGQTYKLPRKRAPHPVCLSWQMPHPSAIVIQAFNHCVRPALAGLIHHQGLLLHPSFLPNPRPSCLDPRGSPGVWVSLSAAALPEPRT